SAITDTAQKADTNSRSSPVQLAPAGAVSAPAPQNNPAIKALSPGDSARATASATPDTSKKAPPVRIEESHSIDFAKNLTEYRSPRKAMLLSFLVPGLGQAYVHSYTKAGIFFTVEVALAAGAIWYNSQGKKFNNQAKTFADENYSVDSLRKYSQNLYTFLVNDYNKIDTAEALAAYFTNIFPDTQSFFDAAKNKSGEFYADIGSATVVRNSYVQGWKDCQPPFNSQSGYVIGPDSSFSVSNDTSAPYFVNRIKGAVGNPLLDSNQYGFSNDERRYIDMISRSKSQYDISQYLIYALVVNHIVSAIDAALSAKSFNDRLLNKETMWDRINLRQELVNTGNATVFGYSLCLRF
ncbi:MAG: DUF5683 domain-containing protein, partial [Chitinivibrionales bacterium]|nr:DUF5683 domain-containing protein [Chitinivibrionales bacterium]